MDMVAEEKAQVLHQIISAMVQQDVDLGIQKFHRHMGEAIANGSPSNAFATMTEKWNSSIYISKKIFP